MHKYDNQYLRCRDGVYYFVRRVPNDLKDIYTSDRISISLKTKLIRYDVQITDGWCER